jgi:hypothetical protein
VFVSIPAPVADPDILTTIEYWGFRLGLLTVFMLWVVEHAVHALIRTLKALILACRELHQLWRSQAQPGSPRVIPKLFRNPNIHNYPTP